MSMGFGRDGKGVIIREDVDITLGTLAQNTAIKATSGGLGGAMDEDFRMIKSEFNAAFEMQAAGDEFYIGIADNELTVAEIAECLAVNGPIAMNDNLGRERAERPVWLLGIFSNNSKNQHLLPVEFKLRWTFSNDEGWTWFAFNPAADALTTGAIVNIHAKHYGVWSV